MEKGEGTEKDTVQGVFVGKVISEVLSKGQANVNIKEFLCTKNPSHRKDQVH